MSIEGKVEIKYSVMRGSVYLDNSLVAYTDVSAGLFCDDHPIYQHEIRTHSEASSETVMEMKSQILELIITKLGVFGYITRKEREKLQEVIGG